jgi:nitrogen fixation/metabolism regulation signal transduction histidine kinase
LFAISDSLSFDVTVLSDSPVSKAGLSHVQLGDSDFLIYTHLDSQDIIGAGILLPDNYAERGRRLNESIAVVTSMQLFKTFSLKLLSITVAVAVILSLILSILISRLISRRMSRPLDLLLRGVQLIGQGELDYRVNVTGSDEFSNLGRSFNMMAGELKANQTKLLEAQRVAAWREVARRVAHEIKNPLTPIAIQLYRIEQELAGDENHPERMDAIISIKSQLAILQDLARHFAAFAKEPSLNTAPCHLNDIIHEAVLPYVSPSKLTIKVDIDPRLPRLNLDMQMMRLAFGNLIKNSIEASPEGAAICIQARPLGAEVEIIFRDNGPGFPSGKLSQIDQPYITSKPGGTGLGMIIVKKIIEEHGGSIAFSNDRGAVITIRLPIPSAGK